MLSSSNSLFMAPVPIKCPVAHCLGDGGFPKVFWVSSLTESSGNNRKEQSSLGSNLRKTEQSEIHLKVRLDVVLLFYMFVANES